MKEGALALSADSVGVPSSVLETRRDDVSDEFARYLFLLQPHLCNTVGSVSSVEGQLN